MKEYHSRNFKVERLLIQGVLDIRGIAEKNRDITAKEYFAMVERFLENASTYTEMAVITGDNDPLKAQLRELDDVLTKIGYVGLSGPIRAALMKLGQDDMMGSNTAIVEIVAEVRSLYDKIKSAHASKRFETDSDANADDSNDQVLLWEALEYIDYQEAHRKLRVLAVDDVAVVLNTITSVLSPYYEVYALSKASQVVAFLENHTPELFLLDIEMPELSGYDLVSVIRSNKKHANTPIIFLTGNATMENIRTALSMGVSDFITKPVNKDILLEKIERLIVWKKAF